MGELVGSMRWEWEVGGGRWEVGGSSKQEKRAKTINLLFPKRHGGRCRPTPVNTCDWRLPCLPRRSGNSAQEVCCHCRRPPCSLQPCLKQPLSSNLFQAPKSFEGCRTFSIFFNLRQSSSSFRQAELFTDFRRKSSPVPFGKASRLVCFISPLRQVLR